MREVWRAPQDQQMPTDSQAPAAKASKHVIALRRAGSLNFLETCLGCSAGAGMRQPHAG
jgi:hypothetical protein